MQFTTKVPIPKSKSPINYSSRIMAMGSCFAENMGKKFHYFKFQNAVNPFGIVFNPVSIEKLVSRIVNHQKFTENDIFFHNERWHSYEVHSDCSHSDPGELVAILNRIIETSNQQITDATHLILTYGTSWVYQLKATGQIVANCHKVPQNQFDKVVLPVEMIEKSIQHTIDCIRKVNPDCDIIFTISPVRHLKDGFVENQQSKAHLITAVHRQLSGCTYFPSYEIMMDELRDYRFYADDLLHPSAMAIDYIWERFCESQMEEAIFNVMEDVDSIQKSLLHQPFYPNSESHQKFLANLNQKIATLVKQFPQIQF